MMSQTTSSCTTRPLGRLLERGWLSLTSEDFQKVVFEKLKIRQFKAGETVTRAGEPGGGLWGLVDGGIRIEQPDAQLTRELMQVSLPGFWFGERALLWNGARQHDVYAARPLILATISLADCQSILAENPAHWKWIALLAQINGDLAIGLVADLLLKNPRRRLVAIVLRLSGRKAGLNLSSGEFHISQQQLGEIANLSRTVVNETLLDLERRGLISISYRSIKILDATRLRAILAEH